MKNPLNLDATINGPVVELRYASHGEAMRQLRILREQLAQHAELLEALKAFREAYERDRYRSWEKGIPMWEDAVALADAAIAKATGETK